MKIKLILYIMIIFFFQNVFAKEIIYKDELKALVNNDIILNSELEKHLSSLIMLINVKKHKNLNKQVLKDLINTKLQIRIARKYGIDAHDDEVKSVYMQFILRNKLSLLEYNDLIKSHNISGDEINVFIKENIIAEKLHEKLLQSNLSVTREELNSFLDFSNNILIKHQNLSYEILKVSVNRKNDNKKNFFLIKKILMSLKNDYYEIFNFINDKSISFKNEIIVLNSFNTLDKRLKEYISKNLEKEVIGPLYTKKKIEFIKILKKNNTANKKDIKTKIKYFFLEKDSNKIKENNIKYIKNNIKYLNKMQNFIQKNITNDERFKVEWLHNTHIPIELYTRINNLNDNQVSEIFETKNGWYLIQKLYQEYDKKSDINKKLLSLIKNEKFKKIRSNWIKNLKKEAYIKIY